jgi:enoyl-CoA hydratase/carnithine racemase
MAVIERSEPAAGIVQLTLNRPDKLNAMTGSWCSRCTSTSTP